MKHLLVTLLILSLILVSIMLGLTGTQPGTRLIFQLAQTLHPPLKIGSVSGTLLGNLTLADLSYKNDDLSIHSTRLRLSWHPQTLREGTITVEALTLDQPVIRLTRQKEESAPLTLPAIRFPLQTEIQSLDIHQLEIVQPDDSHVIFDQISLTARMQQDRLELPKLTLVMAKLQVSGKGNVTFQQQWPLAAEIEWRFDDKTRWEGQGEVSGDLHSLSLTHTLLAPFNLSLTANLSHVLENPSFDARGTWDEIAWPLNDDKKWFSRQGRFRIHGHSSAYRFELHSQVSGLHLPPNQIEIIAKGDTRGVVLTPLTLQGPAGQLVANGHVQWLPGLRWDLALQGNDVDSAQFLADWPGLLSLQAHTNGSLDPRLQVALELQRLEGQLRGHPLEASGVFHYRDGRLKADKVSWHWAGNRFRLHGQGSRRQLDLEFDLNAPHLERLAPGLTGTLHGSGKVSGPPQKPTLDLNLKGRQLGWERMFSIDRLSCIAKGGPNDPSSHVRLKVHHLKIKSWYFNEALLSGEGQMADHRFQFSARGPLGKIFLRLQGGIAASGDSHWQGQVQQLPLALTGPLLPEGVTAAGNVYAHFSYLQKGERRKGELQWELRDGSFSAPAREGRPLAIELSGGKGTVVLEDHTVHLAFDLPVAGHGKIGAELTTDLQSKRLQGEARLDFTRLGLIEVFVPAFQEVKGAAKGEVLLTGEWEHPKVQADAILADLSAEVPAAGIHLEEGRFNAVTRADGSIALQGHLRSGEGALEMAGKIDLAPKLAASLTLRGKRFLAADLPEARVLVSPELTLDATGKRVDMKGKVHIPEAEIDLRTSLIPNQEPGMVAVSPDEVIVGRPKKEAQNPPLEIAADVLLTLGDRVFFNGFGIESQLQGELRLTSWKGLPKGEGEIRIVKGKFAAYGQKLDIKSGRLVFSGPVDNPGLDIQVARHFPRERITINLRIGGFAQEPVIKITSDPSMPEDEALSYLIAGRSLRSKSSATSGSMEKQLANALSSLGVSYLKDLGAGKYAELEFEEGFMYVGKYLTPDLYLGYAVDVFDGLGEVVVRYRLSERLSLEGRYGKSQSGDLFYTLETD